MSTITRRLVVGLVLGVVALVGMGIYADARKLGESLSNFAWVLALPVIGLTLLNYALRFMKWHYYLRLVGERPPVRDSALVFVSGLSMAVTPGKFGELLKAVLLRDRCGVPATKTASVVIAERATDFFALIFLAGSGVLTSRHGTVVLSIAIVGSVAFLGCIASERLSLALIHLIGRIPVGRKIAPRLEEMYRAMAVLMRPVPLTAAIVLSVASWFCECVGFHLVLTGLAGTSSNLATATFIYAFATIFGAVTMLPGGLLATEGSLIGLTHQVFGLAAKQAATAGAMLIRFATLWFAVLVGLVGLFILKRTGSGVDIEEMQRLRGVS